MLSKVKSVAFKGLQVVEIDVEVNINRRGIPSFDIVGLPNKSIEESRHRIKSAFINSGYVFPDSKITVNLAPADINKVGSSYDLPIAVGIFCAQTGIEISNKWFFFGELSLDGKIRHTRGAYLAVDHVDRRAGSIFLSSECASSIDGLSNASLFGVSKLGDVFSYLKGERTLPRVACALSKANAHGDVNTFDIMLADVIGQETAKRALEISAAGRHNLMFVGSPGTGKTMLARSVISILPPLISEDLKEVRKIYSYIGKDTEGFYIRQFRNPHHTISYSGMIGGGVEPMPGEITLAHKGVLFMDEFCEFSRNVLEALRQPMQDGEVLLTRNNVTYKFPADFTLIAASNPCPCGYHGHPIKSCVCTEQKVRMYTQKLSGPLADRFDLFVSVYPEDGFVTKQTFDREKSIKETVNIRRKVENCQKLRDERVKKYDGVDVRRLLLPDAAGRKLLNEAYKKLHFSPRAYFKIIKVARTIADLEESIYIQDKHIAEALQYRQR